MNNQVADSLPRVGIGVFVFRSRSDRRFLLGLRKGSHGAGTLSLAGGHLEKGETFAQCGIRETQEETGLEIEDVQFVTAVESFFNSESLVEKERSHYVTIFVTGFVKDEGDGELKEPVLMEPDKCEGWSWYSFREMRGLNETTSERLFLPLRNLIAQRPDVCAALEHEEKSIVES